jgi:FtsP/CotA-like multicopper oxidase with cupredoxin domain
VLGAVGWLWWRSLVPSTYSVMDMGYLDYGGGPRGVASSDTSGMDMGGTAHVDHSSAQVSVADLTGPRNGRADVVVHLLARRQAFRLASGERVEGFTLNGTSPGPRISATVGQLVEVHLHNQSVRDGITLHWHGVDVPNAEDGVAGVTQDAVPVGGDHTYRFVVPHVGTYWYHSHQVSHEQVEGGLFGTLVVLPPHPDEAVRDITAAVHLYGPGETINGHTGDQAVAARPGQRVRVRLVNTDNGPLEAWATGPLRLLATDGYDISRPTPVVHEAVDVPAGGRADLEVTVPTDGTAVRVQVPAASLLIGPPGSHAPRVEQPGHQLDRLHYGSAAPVPFDTAHPDRSFTYAIGRRLGFVDGRPGLQWSVNGHLFPDMPMFVVARGDVVRIRLENSSGDTHPMHLHGHHAVVLSRDGKPVTGSPWWVDSLDVRNGESYEIAFVADNPGIWMDHCHNLQHAAQGLVTHLMYQGVTEPYRVGGRRDNAPE